MRYTLQQIYTFKISFIFVIYIFSRQDNAMMLFFPKNITALGRCDSFSLMPQTLLSVASGDIYVSWCMIMTFNRLHPREGSQKECKHIWNLKGGTVKSGKARQQDGWITRRELSALCDNNVGTHAPSAALLLVQMLFATGHSWCFSTGDLYRRDWAKEKALRSAVEENFSAKKTFCSERYWGKLDTKTAPLPENAAASDALIRGWRMYMRGCFCRRWKLFNTRQENLHLVLKRCFYFGQHKRAHTNAKTCGQCTNTPMCMCVIEEAQGAC